MRIENNDELGTGIDIGHNCIMIRNLFSMKIKNYKDIDALEFHSTKDHFIILMLCKDGNNFSLKFTDAETIKKVLDTLKERVFRDRENIKSE